MGRLRILCALLLLLPQALLAAPRKRPARSGLAPQIEVIVHQQAMASAEWGIDVLDLESGKVLYSLNPDHLFVPASNVKLLTTAAALALAGPDYRFHTTIETTGKLDSDGRLLGDLVIVGRGDANMSGRVLPYQLKTERVSPPTQALEELADQIVRKGIKVVDGDVIGDDTFYSAQRYGEGWAYDDLQWLDGAPVSALTFNDNVLFIRIHPGASTVMLWGSIPLNDAGLSEAVSIDDPAEFTAELLRAILEKRGITITGKTLARHGELAQFFDQPEQEAGSRRAGRQCCREMNDRTAS